MKFSVMRNCTLTHTVGSCYVFGTTTGKEGGGGGEEFGGGFDSVV